MFLFLFLMFVLALLPVFPVLLRLLVLLPSLPFTRAGLRTARQTSQATVKHEREGSAYSLPDVDESRRLRFSLSPLLRLGDGERDLELERERDLDALLLRMDGDRERPRWASFLLSSSSRLLLLCAPTRVSRKAIP